MQRVPLTDELDRNAELGPETPVWIWQRTWEFEALLDLYRELKPMNVLEIGTFDGGTLYHWLKNATPGARVMTIDPEPRTFDFHAWCPEGVTLDIVTLPSIGAINVATPLAPFDWIFLDGEHLEWTVRADWHMFSPLVRSGGIFALHDILPSDNPAIDVAPVWREIQARGFVTQELIADPHAEWGGIGVVYL